MHPSHAFDADALPLKSVLFSDDVKLHVPEYQREFSWDKDQFESFWDDIVSPEAPESRFAGTFLLMDAEPGGSREIVDGQQRATVATVVVAAVRNVALEQKQTPFAKTIQRLDIQVEDPDTGELGDFRLTPGLTCRAFFRRVVQDAPNSGESLEPSSREERRILKALEYFTEKIRESIKGLTREDSLDELKKVRKRVREMQLVRILIFKSELKFEIFESVNARGLNLSPADLIKNYLISKKTEKEQKKLAEIWQEISSQAEEYSMPLTDVIRYHWNGTHKFVTVKNLFDAIKKQVSTEVRVDQFVNRSIQAVEVLHIVNRGSVEQLRNGIGSKKQALQFQRSVELLRILGTKLHQVLVLALYRYREDLPGGSVSRLTDALARFSIAHFGLCQGPGNQVERFFSSIARDLTAALDSDSKSKREKAIGKAFSKAEAGFKDRWPNDAKIKEALEDLSYQPLNRTKAVIRSTFALLEYSYDSGSETVIDWSQVNIEHVQPQRPENAASSEDYLEVVHSLGNLVLLSESVNKKLGNLSPKEKAPALKESVFRLTREAAKQVADMGWKPSDVVARDEAIRKRIAKAVSCPF